MMMKCKLVRLKSDLRGQSDCYRVCLTGEVGQTVIESD